MYQLKKYKRARRLGAHLFEKTQGEKFSLRNERYVGKTNRKRRSTLSDYGAQMLEKQRVKMLYGLRERQFRRYIDTIIGSYSTNQVEHLFDVLERRLDNVVYRLGLAPTRQASRQMVTHGHFEVNGRRVNVPSFPVAAGHAISVRKGSKGKNLFAGIEERQKGFTPPSWLSVDFKNLEAKVTGAPKFEKGGELIDLGQVLEFYKR